MKKQGILLFLILGLPVFIYLMYLTLAKNTYKEIPILGIVPSDFLQNIKESIPDENAFFVVGFTDSIGQSTFSPVVRQLSRVAGTFKSKEQIHIRVLLQGGGLNNQTLTLLGDKANPKYKMRFVPIPYQSGDVYLNSFAASDSVGRYQVIKDQVFTANLFIVDAKGQIRGCFNGLDTKAVEEMMGVLRILMLNSKTD